MASRIKVTGYIEVDDLREEHVDLTSPDGLSSAGYTEVAHGANWNVGDLVDLDLELELDD